MQIPIGIFITGQHIHRIRVALYKFRITDFTRWWTLHKFHLDSLYRGMDKRKLIKNYVKNNLGATKLASGWRKVAHYNSSGIWYYAYVNNSANIPSTADVCIFYDWNDNGIIDHSSYCVGTGTSSDDTGYGDLIDQHTNDRYKTIWTLDQWNDTHRYTVAIYAFQL